MSRYMRLGWTDGRARQAQAASGELELTVRWGEGVAYKACGYKQGRADGRAGRRASRRPK